jgi:hypothetical protein
MVNMNVLSLQMIASETRKQVNCVANRATFCRKKQRVATMKTTDEYKASVSNAIAFKHEHPDEKSTTAARIY